MPGPVWTNERLSEKDARTITTKIVEKIFALGGHVSDFGIHLAHEGFYFCAEVNGQRVYVQTGQGNFEYLTIATELLLLALKQAAEQQSAVVKGEPHISLC